jgi:hypothetical protein
MIPAHSVSDSAAEASSLGGVMLERRRISDRVAQNSDDLISYYTLNAERGDVQAQLTLGQV